MYRLRALFFAVCASTLLSCEREKEAAAASLLSEHPLFPPMIWPADNRPNDMRIALGEKLFFDPILSRDSSVACGHCHFPDNAFSDTIALSIGFHGRSGMRNAPPLQNLAWRHNFFHDGGIRKLELQVFAPLFDSAEMAFQPIELEERLNRHPTYPKQFQQAYGRDPDFFGLVRALAAFERSLISPESDFDRWLSGEESALSEKAKRGMALFYSQQTACGSCHSGIFLSDDRFYNIGLANGNEDVGRYRITRKATDSAKFRTPSLRQLRLTAPYMHDGSLASLEEVIEHYDRGGGEDPLKDKRIRPLKLTEGEKDELLAFLKVL